MGYLTTINTELLYSEDKCIKLSFDLKIHLKQNHWTEEKIIENNETRNSDKNIEFLIYQRKSLNNQNQHE